MTNSSNVQTLKVSPATRAAVNSICAESTATQDAVVAAGVQMLQTRGLASNGLVRLELVRSIDNLESTVQLLVASNLALADYCSALLDTRLANIDRVVADAEASIKEANCG